MAQAATRHAPLGELAGVAATEGHRVRGRDRARAAQRRHRIAGAIAELKRIVPSPTGATAFCQVAALGAAKDQPEPAFGTVCFESERVAGAAQAARSVAKLGVEVLAKAANTAGPQNCAKVGATGADVQRVHALQRLGLRPAKRTGLAGAPHASVFTKHAGKSVTERHGDHPINGKDDGFARVRIALPQLTIATMAPTPDLAAGFERAAMPGARLQLHKTAEGFAGSPFKGSVVGLEVRVRRPKLTEAPRPPAANLV